MNRNRMMNRKIIFTALFLMAGSLIFAQQDSRYDAGKNLPFNQKAGNVDPQTGNVTVQVTDLSLPGRAGMDFSFGRIWKTNQSNIFSMSRNPVDGSNRLTSHTIEEVNNMGAGWATSLPYILSDDSSGDRIISLFFGGGAYEIDQTGVKVRNLNKSNILWYDLLDKRIYEDSSKAYTDGPVAVSSLSSFGVADNDSERNKYELILKDNSRYLFRPDGKLMTHIDKSGLNEIWYYYDSADRLSVVVDTIGRIIRFSYDGDSNLEKIEWDVISHEIGEDGSRKTETETRSITYSYQPASNYSNVSSLVGLVSDYNPSYALTSVKDAMGHETRYEYTDVKASFSYESHLSHWQNASLLLTGIRNFVDGADLALSEKRYEYAVPAKGMYTKYFWGGYMEYYKVSRQWNIDREGREVGNTTYIYHDNNEAGNFNCYTTLVETGGVRQTYLYTISSDPSQNDVLDTLTTETGDGYVEQTDYVYNSDRVKTLEETYRMGQFAFSQKYLYDLKGNLKEHTDKMGLVTVKQYDDKYSIPVRETRLFQSAGEDKEYDLERVLTPLGQVEKEILYIDDEGITRGLVTSYDYDSFGNVISVTDPGGIVSHTVYDSAVNAWPVRSWQIVSEENYLTRADADFWFNLPDTTNQIKLSSWRVFNSDGSPWLEVDAEGFAVEHYYDDLGSEITTIYPDENDVLLAGSDFDDISTHVSWSAFLTSRENNPGVRQQINYENAYVKTLTDFEYDDAGHSWSTLSTAVQQDGLGNVVKEITYGAGGFVHAVKTMTYDLYGRMVALTDPDAGTTSSSIWVNDVKVNRFDKTWLVKYDDLGRTIKVLYPDTGSGSKIKLIRYNDRENSIMTTDPEGSDVYERMDWNGNVVERIAYGNSSTVSTERQTYTFEYDQLNRMTKSTDPEGQETGYRFDERNLLIRQIYGNGSDYMIYNDRGLLISKTDRKGQIIAFSYDEAGRNTRTEYYKSGAVTPDDTEYRLYDKRGNVIRVENKTLIEQCEFDGAGRLASLNRRLKDILHRNSIATVYGGSVADQVFSFDYGYTASGLLRQMTYPDGSVHDFSYDQYLGYLSSIGEGSDEAAIAPFVTDLKYNKSGVVTEMAYSNGTTQLWDFDNRKRIERIRIGMTDTPGRYIEDLNYQIDGSGNIKAINDNKYGYDGFHRIATADTKLPEIPDARAIVEEHFGTYNGGDPVEGRVYDAAADLYPNGTADGRVNGEDYLQALIDLEGATAEGDLPFDRESFAYDRNGNRTKIVQNGDEYFYSYGERNRLEKIDVKREGELSRTLYAQYAYDENGNTTSRTIYGQDGIETVVFEYDVLNRLIKTTRGSEYTEYTYDNAGNRVVKVSSDGSLTLYLRHGTIAVAMDMEVNGDQTDEKGSINRYVLSGDLVAGRVTTTVNADNSTDTEKNFYHLDHLNSTKVVTDESGEVVVNYTYRAFGEQLKRLDSANNPTEDLGKYSYGGKELDEDINLYYFNARFYDATTGRFINVDPVQDGTNWYAYVNNDPLNRIDPTGLESADAAYSWVKSFEDAPDFKEPVDAPVTSKAGPREPLNTSQGESSPIHKGWDYAPTNGETQTYGASADGKILVTDSRKDIGSYTVLDHGNGWQSHYYHDDVPSLYRDNEPIESGQMIGGMGQSGKATGPHLHFEIRKDGESIDPAVFFNRKEVMTGCQD
ncbi:peptidoglycan DD-metalloendopeptidase family protein [Spirochaeta isovalerica]|uniref:RHS repeat-associated protein n=1 Tax=Spirochaeta isovalerica TaxID=150 RepID=A0A841R6R9_9SPIO|nr:peptidoglycan DD-metalloendopeptidase family protein [Spirochaeta isovalerica]MBB6478468.1 RHS repeat-associated protein [Spirochaeta isovalerica]